VARDAAAFLGGNSEFCKRVQRRVDQQEAAGHHPGGSAVPHFLVAGSHVKGKGHHLARGGVALIVGIAALIGAWFATKSKSS
jgi:hypothetical protein